MPSTITGVVGQFRTRERGAEGGLLLLAFQKGDCIHKVQVIVRAAFR
jgi:hypothetical protein